MQDSLVARALGADGESGAQFSEDDEGQPDFSGSFERVQNERVAAAEVGVAIGVEGEFQRHIPIIFQSINERLGIQKTHAANSQSSGVRPGDLGQGNRVH